MSELRRNTELCVREKAHRVSPHRHRYPEWWLLLPDYVSHGRRDYADPDVAACLELQHDWERVILLDPLDLTAALEIQRVSPDSVSPEERERSVPQDRLSFKEPSLASKFHPGVG